MACGYVYIQRWAGHSTAQKTMYTCLSHLFQHIQYQHYGSELSHLCLYTLHTYLLHIHALFSKLIVLAQSCPHNVKVDGFKLKKKLRKSRQFLVTCKKLLSNFAYGEKRDQMQLPLALSVFSVSLICIYQITQTFVDSRCFVTQSKSEECSLICVPMCLMRNMHILEFKSNNSTMHINIATYKQTLNAK